jgi:hypothetical protein
MTPTQLISHRLINQQITATSHKQPHELVDWMVAMQSQDWAMAKWGIGLRLSKLKEADVEKAFNEGSILRTHVMRPTWHFVTPQNIRWLLALTAPRVKAFIAYYDRQLELDKKVFKRSHDVLAKALGGENFLTRNALQAIMQKAKINATGQRMGHLLIHAELDAVICSGPRQGKQFTYALMDERAPVKEKFDKNKALANLTQQYFISRGPATVRDYAWWSGLGITEAREGIALLASKLEKETINGEEYFYTDSAKFRNVKASFLMPDYDEYGISYKDRSAIFGDMASKKLKRDGNPIFNHIFVIDGVAAGTWQRKVKGKKTVIETAPFSPLNAAKQRTLDKAVKRYEAFFV